MHQLGLVYLKSDPKLEHSIGDADPEVCNKPVSQQVGCRKKLSALSITPGVVTEHNSESGR